MDNNRISEQKSIAGLRANAAAFLGYISFVNCFRSAEFCYNCWKYSVFCNFCRIGYNANCRSCFINFGKGI